MSNSKEKEDKKVKEAKKNASDILSVLKEAISVKLHEMLDAESTFDLIDSDFIMDYMMLVASSREKTKSKIIEDLNFILNDKTEEFVNWYLDIWQKLSKVSTSKSLAKRGGGVAASLFQQVTNDLKRKYKDQIDPVGSTIVDQMEKLVREDVTIKMESESTQNKKSHLSPTEIETTQANSAVGQETSSVEANESVAATNKNALSPLTSYESIEACQEATIEDKEPLSYESVNELQPVQSSTPAEVPSSEAMPSSKSNKTEEDDSDFEEDVLVADTGDLNVSDSSSSKESDSMSLDSTEYKAKQVYTKAKVHQWLKRRHVDDASHSVKRQKLVSTVQMLEPESNIRPPSLKSIIAPPPSTRCVVPSQILLRAMRDANKSTVSIPPASTVERGSKNVATKQRSQEADDDSKMIITTLRIKHEEEEEEEEQNLESSHGSSGHSGEMSDISQNDLEYYYENNDDLEYESDGGDVQSGEGLIHTEEDIEYGPRSPTFVVTMNKDHQEYLAAIQRPPVNSDSAKTRSQHKSSGEPHSTSNRSSDSQQAELLDRRIVKVNSGIFNEYRTRAMSDEDKDMDTLENFKRFKKFRETRRSRYETPRNKRKFASSDSSEEEFQSKIHKTEPRDRDEPNLPVEQLKLDSKSSSEEHMLTPPPYNPGHSSPAVVNNAMSEYYSTMEEWIADPNHPMALHLPPPMPLAPPPAMPPGFLPPPPPTVPPPMPPGFLPPPPAENLPGSGNGYEINVKVPAQNNNNLITVQCQNLDFSNKQTTPASPTTLDKVPCKFYPNCSKADCPFFHRTKCTTFPLCRFGNNCAYLHPACKFGSACSRVDCVFDHSAVLLKTKPPTPAVNTSDVCKFHPKCFNANCVFFHPKICMYSSNCRNKACVFFHPAQDQPSVQNKITPETGSLSKIANKFSLRRVNA